MDLGGGARARSSILTPEQLSEVKEKIKKGVPYLDIQREYNISASFISSINQGVYFRDDKETYPLFRYYKDDTDYDELLDLLVNSPLTLTDIAKQLGIGYSTVKKINQGTLRHGLYPTYPIRQKTAYEQRADIIKALLKQGLSNEQIMDAAGASNETIRRINLGLSFSDSTINYPIRE